MPPVPSQPLYPSFLWWRSDLGRRADFVWTTGHRTRNLLSHMIGSLNDLFLPNEDPILSPKASHQKSQGFEEMLCPLNNSVVCAASFVYWMYVLLPRWDYILVTLNKVTRTFSPASIPWRETVAVGTVEMGPSHQALTSTKRRALLIALGVLALKKQNSSSLTMCETQSCRELSGSSTSPSQLGIYPHSKESWEIIIHNYIRTQRKLEKVWMVPWKPQESIPHR